MASPDGGEGRLELLEQLKASLERSHRAVVALNLAEIEQGTKEQRTLCRNLAEQIRRSKKGRDERESENSELAQELRRSEWRVLAAARLQAALLKRAQRKLQVMANMLAGAERIYASPTERNHGFPLQFRAENGVERCRV